MRRPAPAKDSQKLCIGQATDVDQQLTSRLAVAIVSV